MNYTVKQFSNLSGVSPRTLRFYDQIGLLKPAFINSSGYRVYGPEQVDRLQHILFFRELKFRLKDIHRMLDAPDFNLDDALSEQLHKLMAERQRLDLLIATAEKTVAAHRGGKKMTDEEKFAGLKKKILAQNEEKYGNEIREKYGEKVIKQANEQFARMSKKDYEAANALQEELFQNLSEALAQHDAHSAPAQKAADLHRRWLSYFWPQGTYSTQAHNGLAQMYVDDPRFRAYYDSHVAEGAAQMLRDAVRIYTSES